MRLHKCNVLRRVIDMEGIYEWIRNITYYLIFMTVVTNLLPDKK